MKRQDKVNSPKRQRKSGRPAKFCPEIVEAICAGHARSMFLNEILKIVGISRQTFYDWKKRYPDFLDALNVAIARGRCLAIYKIQRAGRKDWRASAWWLEKTYPEEYGRRRI